VLARNRRPAPQILQAHALWPEGPRSPQTGMDFVCQRRSGSAGGRAAVHVTAHFGFRILDFSLVIGISSFVNSMPWPPDIAGELPAPRDEEPSSLRQDIADELGDHLKSSFNRELHFTREESSAKRNVLDRFGDPRHVARQLWFDAMKEKIVSQRLTLVMS